jgi:hypothetical protein
MNKILLITRPKHDITVHYLFHWAKQIIELAKNKNISVLDLDKERANRREVSSMLQKKEPLLVFFNGHGDNDCVKGHDDEILLAVGENEQLLISKIVYSLSCRSGKNLGPKSVQNGALGYLGYDDDFIFFIEDDKIGSPLEDKTAELFLEASNQVMISLIKGHTIKESYEKSKNIFRENILRLAASESQDSYLIQFLVWDMQHQVCLGEESAHF